MFVYASEEYNTSAMKSSNLQTDNWGITPNPF